MAFGGPAGGVAPGIVGLGDVSALSEEGIHDFEPAAARRHHQRCHSVLVLGIDRSPGVEEELGGFELIPFDRQVQWRVPELLLGIEPRAGFDQDRDDSQIAAHRAVMEPGTRFFIALVRIGAVSNEQPYGAGIVLLGRASNVFIVAAEGVELRLRRRSAQPGHHREPDDYRQAHAQLAARRTGKPGNSAANHLSCHTPILAKPPGMTTLWPLEAVFRFLATNCSTAHRLICRTSNPAMSGSSGPDREIPGCSRFSRCMLCAHADIIVYDALVDPRILRLGRSGAALCYAGKRGGRPSPSQPDISARLVRAALEGNRVLRLKGGDPCVFGRGGEEALALAAAGVPFRIVPGITAGIGGLAYAGIPVTHRDANSAVTFLTGHNSDGVVPGGLDWDAIARGAPVLVLYMASRHLRGIVGRLMSAGRRPDEPVAVISKATTPGQQVFVSTLGEIAAKGAEAEAPAIIVVGEVVRLRAELDWLGALAARRRDPTSF